MRALIVGLGLMLACGHQAPEAQPEATVTTEAPVVITREADLDAHVGQTVILRGEVARTRIATLLGVDIEEGGMSGLPAEALGVLERDDVSQDEIDQRVATSGQYAHRGAGRFYRLVAPDGHGLAVARPVTP